MLDFFALYLKNNVQHVNRFLINFFWWEPLLEFENIQYFIQQIGKERKIQYSLWTNGLLLNKERFLYLKSCDVELYLSVDTETYVHVFKKDYLLDYKKLKINFILNPKTLEKSFVIFTKLVEKWFKNFNIIPVYATLNWNLEEFQKLEKFVAFVKKIPNIDSYFFSFYEDATSDIQFVLDTNGILYKDIHTHFWFLKQYSFVSDNIKEDINTLTQLTHISNLPEMDIKKIIEKYDNTSILQESILLAKKLCLDTTFKKLHSIIKI